MDEEDRQEKQYSMSPRGEVRPSMVVMTSKILKVSEGMAAMNLRIAFGVFLCVLLLIATFVVNVVAFEFAKENKITDGQMVDKATGNMVQVTADSPPTDNPDPVLDVSYLRAQRGAVSQSEKGHIYGDIFATLDFPCADVSEELSAEYCDEDRIFLGLTANPRLAYFYYQDADDVRSDVVDPDVLDSLLVAGIKASRVSHTSRRLSHIGGDSYYYWKTNSVSYAGMTWTWQSIASDPNHNSHATPAPTAPTAAPTAAPAPAPAPAPANPCAHLPTSQIGDPCSSIVPCCGGPFCAGGQCAYGK